MAKRTNVQARQEILDRINDEGMMVAYETALSLCRDVKAPAAARSAALIAILRAGGMFGTEKSAGDKEPHEMSAEELTDAIQELEDMAHARARAGSGLNDEEEGDDIFK